MSWEEVGRLTIPRLRALGRAWRRHPPVPVLLKLLARWKDQPDDQSDGARKGIAEFLAEWQAIGGKVVRTGG